ncbi:acyl carrier protein [Streptomyces sp. TG1A-8]|uniref:acyl carrier protein n=1 Tax=Streptomyces sp. TG1A-8 TaxID=3051385 RepID=UPI00265BCB87|nr:acyl carrier protein [Streptomyces sp. TG1A-8]MDO0924256.1 acyl carrier protein [Streptomyces sp. TG1A-8]
MIEVSHDFPSMEKLRLMPLHERRDMIEDLVIEEFKQALFMTERDEMPLDVGFFDLGLTSLRLSEVKLALERKLECEISTAALFGHPTAGQLIDHLSE